MPLNRSYFLFHDPTTTEIYTLSLHDALPIYLTKHGLLFCVDAHRDGKRFIVKADDLLTAFLSLESDTIAAKGANGNATRQKDRKSTRLNSSHVSISYAVFCLKKKSRYCMTVV